MYDDMDDTDAIVIVIALLLSAAFFIVPIIREIMLERKRDRLNFLRSFTKHVIRITKQDANFLIKNCTTLVNNKILSLGDNYFMWEEKLPAIGWVEYSAGLKPKTLLVARPYNFDIEQNIKNRNKSSRLLVFRYSERKEDTDSTYMLRHVWASGKLENLNDLIKEIFSQEQFKSMLERNSDVILEPNALVEQLELQAEAAKVIDVANVFIVTEFDAHGKGESRRKVILKIYPAQDCYQVTSTVCCAEINKKN